MAALVEGKIVVPQSEGTRFVSVSDTIRKWASRNPHRNFLITNERNVTWSDFDARLNKVANALLESGLERGDKIAILAANSIEYLEIFLGATRAGICVVPLSVMFKWETSRDLINDSDSRMLFASTQFTELIGQMVSELRNISSEGLFVIGSDVAGWRSYDDWVNAASEAVCAVEIGPEDDFNIIYSSGTTGKPKGIVHSQYLRAAMGRLGDNQGYDDTAVSLVSTPLFSNATFAGILITLLHGGSLLLMARFSAGEFLALAQTHRITHALLVPVQFERILAHPQFADYDLSSFRSKVSTSAPLRERVKRDCVARWPGKLFEVYTLTEGGIVTVLDATERADKLNTVGKAGPGCVLKVIDENGSERPLGEVGEIVGRAAVMMKGYYKSPEKTQELIWFDRDGELFFKSGDMGKIDSEGYVHLLDRQKDMIISGGFNVYPVDIENVLLSHPAVADAAVIGVPSEEWGETPLALVVTREPVEREAFLEWANSKLSKLQRISSVEFREDLPRSAIGKVMKRELREPYWTVNT
jgi:acyl-CoA synthetase (AMP-forming)/AMP-acid ligase II